MSTACIGCIGECQMAYGGSVGKHGETDGDKDTPQHGLSGVVLAPVEVEMGVFTHVSPSLDLRVDLEVVAHGSLT